jgi:hypothetical protein
VALSDQLKSIEWNGTALGVLSSADLIFGCTGRDIFKRKKLPKGLGGAKILASCSTGDNEFLTLLKRAAGEQRRDTNVPFGDASLAQPNGSLTILRGGFPINFDGSRESVAASDIQLTRGLLLGGIVQAVLARGQRREGDERWEKLDPGMQRFVVETWLKSREVRRPWYPETLLRNFEDESWVREESRGYDASYPMLAGAFGH